MSLPRARALVDAARAATRAVLRGVESGDPGEVSRAIETRGIAIDALASSLREDPSARSALSDAFAELDREASLAQAALAAVRDAARESVAALEGRSAAIRGYETGGATSSALDQPA